ncbi:MAG: 4-hydroxyphenylpyruvate dioxygenase [Bdellovibrio sp.]|nr:MAG: 4-hydroxyphenylpyruvate dioxygenase [Bdellovibrio sp.]
MAQVPDDLSNQSNPCGLDGIEFVEFAAPQPGQLEKLFTSYGFAKIATRTVGPGGTIDLFRQGEINFIANGDPNSFARKFCKQHGPCINAMGFRVKDSVKAFRAATSRGARGYVGPDAERGATPFPAVYGIGDSLMYFIDERDRAKLYPEIFQLRDPALAPKGFGFQAVDHLTNNVPVGELQKWCDFYHEVFNFRETRYFDIRGKQTGLISKVMRSPCNKFSIPINEPTDKKSQIQEYLEEYKGPGIQHLALLTEDILGTLKFLRQGRQEFLAPPPATYYKMLRDRLPMVSEAVEKLQEQGILVDGDDKGYLLQIFSKNLMGPIFFEVIQRKNHWGFGEGNFQALFDSIEADQKMRGVL